MNGIFKRYPIKEIFLYDSFYPSSLKKITTPPKKLYCRGNISKDIFEKSLAIVGSRRITQYGKRVLEMFIPTLVSQNITIISGFMYGVDSFAHELCLKCGGKTIAVFGNGLDVIYPPENEKIYKEILEKEGLVISEYSPKTPPHLWTYPQRNRIIAGLATLGVLIVEAGEKSGSLITAKFAKKFGKKVFAIPGPITSSVSVGTNFLIKKGVAKPVLTVEDILEKGVDNKINVELNLDEFEKEILNSLAAEPLNVDEISKIVKLPVEKVSQKLTFMSLKGLIAESAGLFFLKK